MHPERLIMEISLVQNYIFDNFHFDHEVVQPNLNFWYLVVAPPPGEVSCHAPNLERSFLESHMIRL